MDKNNPIYLHCFNLIPNFGVTRMSKLFNYFADYEKAYSASSSELELAGLEPLVILEWQKLKTNINLEQENIKLSKHKIFLLDFKNPNYPELLKQISKPPILLYCKGKEIKKDEVCLATVGTRKITTYGKLVIPQILETLINKHITIVSGLAYGIDAECHKTTLTYKGRTIAVLAGGIDEKTIYPQNHVLLSEQICEQGGLIISEYPPFTPALKHHFVARNRIISGLSLGTIVVECSLDSGSLITAKYALEQNRTVYAIPGPIYSEQSKGPNNLIKMGAKLVTEAKDILEDLNLNTLPEEKTNTDLFSLSPNEQKVIRVLKIEPQNFNLIIQASGLTTADATAALTFLEMKGKVRNLGAQQYCLSR